MTTNEQEKSAGRAYLCAAYQALKDARVHCDAAYQEGGVHYNDVTEIMQAVDKMIVKLGAARPRLAAKCGCLRCTNNLPGCNLKGY